MAMGSYLSIITLKITADLSIEILQARREWQDILKVMKEKPTTQITIPGKNLIQNGGEIKSFTDKQKLTEFSTAKPALQQMLKDLL